RAAREVPLLTRTAKPESESEPPRTNGHGCVCRIEQSESLPPPTQEPRARWYRGEWLRLGDLAEERLAPAVEVLRRGVHVEGAAPDERVPVLAAVGEHVAERGLHLGRARQIAAMVPVAPDLSGAVEERVQAPRERDDEPADP